MDVNDDSTEDELGATFAETRAFAKSTKTPRSPKDGALGKNKEGTEISEAEEEQEGDIPNAWQTPTVKKGKKGVKRRASDSPLDQQLVESKELREVLARVYKKVNDLEEKIRSCPNTQKTIKKMVEQLSMMMIKSRNVEEKLFLKESYTTEVFTLENETQTEKEEKIEDIICSRCKEQISREEEKVKQIREEIAAVDEKDTAKINRLVATPWPEAVFRATETIKGKLSKDSQEDLKVVIISKREVGNVKPGHWLDTVCQVYNIGEKLKMNKPILCKIQNNVSVLGEEETNQQVKKVVLLTFTKGNETEIMEHIKMASAVEENGNGIGVALVGEINEEIIKKNLEITFRKEKDGKIKIYNTRAPTREPNTEAVYINEKNVSFADLFKKMKSSVDLEKLNVDVQGIRKLKNGSVGIITGKKNADILKQGILENMQNVNVSVGGNSSVYIWDIDPSYTKEDLAKEIDIELGNSMDEPTNCLVETLRETKYGNQIATVTLKKRIAERLLSKKSIRIGWINCRVKPKITLLRCTNCLKLGHHAGFCKEPKSKEIQCLNCTKTGHFVRDCEESSFCISCKMEGHRNDNFACPEYRAMIEIEKKRLYP